MSRDGREPGRDSGPVAGSGADVPKLPWGTVVRLPAGEWYPRPDVAADHHIHLRVVDTQPAAEPGRAWLLAHGISCTWQSVDCHGPWCWEVQVSVEALRRALS